MPFPPSNRAPIAKIYECVTLYVKRDFVEVVKDLKMGRLSSIIQVASM